MGLGLDYSIENTKTEVKRKEKNLTRLEQDGEYLSLHP